MKKPFFVLVIVISLVTMVVIYFPSGNISNVSKTDSQKSIPVRPIIERVDRSVVFKLAENDECQNVIPIFKENLTSYKYSSREKIEDFFEKAYVDPQRVLTVAESNPEAYIALFNLTTSCFPEALRPGIVKKRHIEGCPNVTMKLKGHPLMLLERAAELGSIEAKLSFSMNARLYREFYHTESENITEEDSKYLLKKAEEYGINAAKAGHPDAYRHMSYAYETGEFGTRDLKLALAFSLPLQKIGNQEDKDYIHDLEKKLSDSEKSQARTIAFGCVNIFDASAVASPF